MNSDWSSVNSCRVVLNRAAAEACFVVVVTVSCFFCLFIFFLHVSFLPFHAGNGSSLICFNLTQQRPD